jgi:flagellar assembly protein FliH
MMMRAAPAKFLFENDFAPGGSKPSMALDEHNARLTKAEAAAYARGCEQGTLAANAEAEQRCTFAIEQILAALEALGQQLSALEARMETEAVEVAVAVARKLVPELLAREPLEEIAALVTGCFRDLVKCPHVVVRVNDSLHTAARDRIDEIVRRCSPDTRLVVLAEPDIPAGDCRIEWADGGIDRDSRRIAAAIDTAVNRYITARLDPAAEPSTASPATPWRQHS